MTFTDRIERGRTLYARHLATVGQQCDIYRQSLTGKVSRGPWNTVAVSVPCLLQQGGTNALALMLSATITGTVKMPGAYGLALPYNTDIKPGDRVQLFGDTAAQYAVRHIQEYNSGVGLIADVEWQKVEQV